MVVKLWEGQRWPLETQMVSLLTYTSWEVIYVFHKALCWVADVACATSQDGGGSP